MIKPSGKPDKDPNKRVWQTNQNKWLPNEINGLLNMPDLFNAAALAKSILYTKWLPPYGTLEV